LVPADCPILIVVGGWPGSGKTTFARALGRRLGLPVFTKDDVKEALFDALGVGDLAWSKRLGHASMLVLYRELELTLIAGKSVIGEAPWLPDLGARDLAGVIDRTGARSVMVVVNADRDAIVTRWRRRAETGERHPGHLDQLLLPDIVERVKEPYTPPDVAGPRIDVDLTDLGDAAVSAALDEVAQALEVSFPDPS
jgi:predicted kinase